MNTKFLKLLVIATSTGGALLFLWQTQSLQGLVKFASGDSSATHIAPSEEESRSRWSGLSQRTRNDERNTNSSRHLSETSDSFLGFLSNLLDTKEVVQENGLELEESPESIFSFISNKKLIEREAFLIGEKMIEERMPDELANYYRYFSSVFPSEIYSRIGRGSLTEEENYSIALGVGQAHPQTLLNAGNTFPGVEKARLQTFSWWMNRSPYEAATWLNRTESVINRGEFVSELVIFLRSKGHHLEADEWAQE